MICVSTNSFREERSLNLKAICRKSKHGGVQSDFFENSWHDFPHRIITQTPSNFEENEKYMYLNIFEKIKAVVGVQWSVGVGMPQCGIDVMMIWIAHCKPLGLISSWSRFLAFFICLIEFFWGHLALKSQKNDLVEIREKAKKNSNIKINKQNSKKNK